MHVRWKPHMFIGMASPHVWPVHVGMEPEIHFCCCKKQICFIAAVLRKALSEFAGCIFASMHGSYEEVFEQ